MNVIEPFPLYAKLNPVHSQILHVRSIWNSFKFFTVSLSAEEIVNETLKYSYMKFLAFAAQPLRIPRYNFFYSPTISTSQYVGDTCRANEKGQGHVRPNSSGEQLFISAINTPSPSSFHFYSARTHSLARARQNLAPSLTASSSVRKSFTASTSSPSYSRQLWKSSLHRRHRRLPPPS